MSWRTSSEPIEPPPPVTRTTCPRTYPMLVVSKATSSRESSSEISTSRSAILPSCCWAKSRTFGRVRIRSPVVRQMARMRLRWEASAEGQASTICSALHCSAIRGRSSHAPYTLTPWTWRPCLVTSSSTRATGSPHMSSSPRRMRLMVNDPVCPAPTMSVRGRASCAPDRALRCTWLLHSARAARRVPAVMMASSAQAMT